MRKSSAPTRFSCRPASLLALLAIAVGCASGGAGPAFEVRVRGALRERGLDPGQIVLPLETTPEMRAWARGAVPAGGGDEERLQQLLLALLQRDGRELRCDRDRTSTAIEVWRDGVANCLSFTHLFVALAREIGLPVYYLRVMDAPRYQREGDLVVASEHIAAAWGPPHRRRILDFGERPAGEYRRTQVISDLSAVALHYSNLGAGRLRAGQIAAALEPLETATRIDPELPDGWINLGVALRGSGRLTESEAAFRRALEADARAVSAYNNLASLLRQFGREEEARRLLDLAVREANRSPFSYLALGDLALAHGRLEEAERFYRQALRRLAGGAEPLAALGECAWRSGRRREAERWLRAAERVDPGEPRTQALAHSLRR